MYRPFVAASFALLASPLALAESVYITPMVGISNGLEVKDEQGVEYQTHSDINYNFSVEVPLQQGRIGLIYSEHNSDRESPQLDNRLRYLQLQSSIYYPVADQWNTYVGIGLGGTQLSSSWYETDYLFSASVFGGVEYQVADNVALQAQLRWFGSLLSSDTASQCGFPVEGGSGGCRFYFSGDWLSQVQGNLGLTLRF